jgi:hypothetical protein
MVEIDGREPGEDGEMRIGWCVFIFAKINNAP